MTDATRAAPARRRVPTPSRRRCRASRAPPSAHAFELTPERAAGIVRQSASARWWASWPMLIVVVFVIGYYFYELGVPGVAGPAGWVTRSRPRRSRAVERGYNIYQANCARCHGVNGQGFANEAGAPPLNEQDKLFAHLNPAYLRERPARGRSLRLRQRQEPHAGLANDNGGPLNYQQIDDLIAFLRATNDHTYIVRDPDTGEPVKDATGKTKTFTGWVDPNYKPAPSATPFPDCWTSAFANAGGSPSPAASVPAGTTVLDREGPEHRVHPDRADRPGRRDVPDQVRQRGRQRPAQRRDQGRLRASPSSRATSSTGVTTTTYTVPALPAGTYPFICTVHPNMTGTLTVK